MFDEFSTVDLPAGMPKEVLQHLKKVRVRNRQLDISLDQGGPRGGGDREFSREKPRFKEREGGRDFGGKEKPRSKDRDNTGGKSSYRPKKSD